MNYEDMKNNENNPVKIFLKDGKTFFYGTYLIKDLETISFTDRRRVTFPIDISLIGVVEPVDKIQYTDGGDDHGR